MDSMKKNVKTNPNLSKLLDRLLANKASYLFTHTQLLSYIGLHIVKNIDWGNPEQEEKICFIAFFHDIALEKDEQSKIKSTLDLKKSELSEIDKSLVERHAQIAAELVSKFPHAPMGSDQIIRQHHGVLNGVGFSEHFGNNVSPMSIVFIVAEEFTRIVLKYADSELNRTQMIRELKESFPTSRFQKVIDLLNTITF
jgi:response regulator RpfG family c-di-GMP phosphodiesterase